MPLFLCGIFKASTQEAESQMDAASFVTRYLDAWNRRDAEAVLSFFDPEVQYSETPYPGLLLSYDDLRENLGDWLFGEHFRYSLLGDVFTAGDALAYRYQYTRDSEESPSPSLEGMQYLQLSGRNAHSARVPSPAPAL